MNMDTETRTWSLLNLILIFITLGFAAMSTSPVFNTPIWLPWIFFGLAFVIVMWLVIHLILSWNTEKALQVRRKAVVDKLSEFYAAGDNIKTKFRENDFGSSALVMKNKWSESVSNYFRQNPDDLGDARLISLRPRQSDWFVYSHFNPFGDNKRDEKYYAFQALSIEMEKLTDLIEEFLR
jgi:hypothetical protein